MTGIPFRAEVYITPEQISELTPTYHPNRVEEWRVASTMVWLRAWGAWAWVDVQPIAAALFPAPDVGEHPDLAACGRCGHPRAQHVIGDRECAIDREDQGEECGCPGFAEVAP